MTTDTPTSPRAALMADQHRIAAAINAYFPRPVGSADPPALVALCAQAEANTAAIRAIDALEQDTP